MNVIDLTHTIREEMPAHLFAGRTTLDRFPASQFIGKALVIDCKNLSEGEMITMAQIDKYGKRADEADFLLFNLGWDKRWGTESYLRIPMVLRFVQLHGLIKIIKLLSFFKQSHCIEMTNRLSLK